jgi:hypothetical protein
VGPIPPVTIDGDGRGRAARLVGTSYPAAGGSLRGERRRGVQGPADRQAVAAPSVGAPGTAFVTYVGRSLDDILCVHDSRRVGNDNTVRWNGRALQIPLQPHRRHYVRATLAVHDYPDGTLALLDGVRCLARYLRDGTPLAAAPKAA